MKMSIFDTDFRRLNPKFDMVRIIELHRKGELFVKDLVTENITNCQGALSNTILQYMSSKDVVLGENQTKIKDEKSIIQPI